jgi:pilus assembly protein Flp/PilA
LLIQNSLRRRIKMRKTGQFISRFWSDEGGAAAAEYALLLAIIAAGLAVAAGTLGGAISDALNSTSTCISTDGATC